MNDRPDMCQHAADKSNFYAEKKFLFINILGTFQEILHEPM